MTGQVGEMSGTPEPIETIVIGGAQAADGRTSLPRHIPPTALRLMANTLGRIKPPLGRQARAALAMDSGDHTFDASALRQRYPDLPTTRLTDALRVHT